MTTSPGALLGEAGYSLILLLSLMAGLAAVELWIPLRESVHRGRRGANLALTAMYFALNFGLTAGVISLAAAMEQRHMGLLHALRIPAVWAGCLGVLILDFSAYVVHVLMHKVPWFWRFHRVHHSDRQVDVTTAFRQHPLEAVLRFVFTFVPAVLLGVSPVATAIYRLLSGINALFEHANIRVVAPVDRSLQWLIVTPHMHKVHHSRLHAETDSNYGNLFPVFDRLFGTFTPTQRGPLVPYGLDSFSLEDLGVADLLALPWSSD